MIVDHSDGLHKRITDGRSYKSKAAALQVDTERIGLGSSGGNLFELIPAVDLRRTTDKFPYIAVECSKLLLHRQESLRVTHRRFDLQSISYNSGIQHEFLNSSRMDPG